MISTNAESVSVDLGTEGCQSDDFEYVAASMELGTEGTQSDDFENAQFVVMGLGSG